MGTPVEAAVASAPGVDLRKELADKQLAKAWLVEHPLLEKYTPDAYVAAFRQLIEKLNPSIVLLPHTYQVRDFAPRLGTALGRVLVSDITGHKIDNGQLVCIRQLFQGKINADIRFTLPAPNFASIQAGAFRADKMESGAADVEVFTPQLDPAQIRTKPLDLFRESARQVDLTRSLDSRVTEDEIVSGSDRCLQAMAWIAEGACSSASATMPRCGSPRVRIAASSRPTCSSKACISGATRCRSRTRAGARWPRI